MKIVFLAIALFFSTVSFAGSDPFSPNTHSCIKREMIRQFPIYSRVEIASFSTVATNDTNIDYMIFLKNPATGQIDSRSFILIRDDFGNASLYFTENSNPLKIDLTSCF